MKKNFLRFFMVITILLLSFTLVSCGNKNSSKSNLQEFYDTVCISQEILDTIADEIYRNWYDAIYKDKFGGDIDLAIYFAQTSHSDDLSILETNDSQINELYKSVKDGKCSVEVKEVISAYSDYYEFVVNVSGSFNSYSANKEVKKKALATALRNLSFEL